MADQSSVDPVRFLWIWKINVTSNKLPEISAGGTGEHQAQCRSEHVLGGADTGKVSWNIGGKVLEE